MASRPAAAAPSALEGRPPAAGSLRPEAGRSAAGTAQCSGLVPRLTRRALLAGAGIATLGAGIRSPHAGPPSVARGVLHLDRNESPLGPSPRVRALAHRFAEGARLYPDPQGQAAREAIARHHGVDPGAIVLACGATGVLSAILQAVGSPEPDVLVARPSYAVLDEVLARAGARPVAVDLEAALEPDVWLRALTRRARIVYVASPHNPTGTLVPRQALEALAAGLPREVWLVVDEVYLDYALGRRPGLEPSMIGRAVGRPGLLVLRSFSKAHGMAGLRVGYAIAHPLTAGRIRQAAVYGAVSRLALAAVPEALADLDHVDRTVALNARSRRRLAGGLAAHGLSVVEGEGNFVLAEVGPGALDIARRLAGLGVLVHRPPDMPRHLRVTTGTAEDVDRFLAGLDAVRRG